MAVICPNCDAPNTDDKSECGLCGRTLPSHDKTWAGPMPGLEREVTNTDPLGPNAEGTGSFEHNLRGIVVGGKIANRYLVKEMLGRGGAAMVFRAMDESLGEEIALKVFPNLSHQPASELDRFKRELLVNRRVSHVNVIRVHDFGIVGDDAYLTMELLGGGTLADRIEEKPLPIADAVEIAIGIAEGLNAAHQAGIVHRDVKPENVLFDDQGRPKLTDFGLARLADSSNTQTRGFSGTPFYMSPEQAEGREITTQTDVYSLGILLFELFTGSLPFFADSLVRIAMLHANEIPPRPSELRPGLPMALEQLVLACLAKKPEARPQGAGSVAASLRKFRRDGGLDEARKLDEDPSFTSLKRRARMGGASDRVDLRVKRPGDRETDPNPPPNRETVLVRVNMADGSSAPRPAAASKGALSTTATAPAAPLPASGQSSAPRPAAAAKGPLSTTATAPAAPRPSAPPPLPPAGPPPRESTNPPRSRDASGARPSVPPPPSREQSRPPIAGREASGSRPAVPRPDATAIVDDAAIATNKNPIAELPLPGEGAGMLRWVLAAGAVLALGIVGALVVPPLLSSDSTPVATPTPLVAVSPTGTPIEVIGGTPVEPDPTPTAIAERTPRPTPSAAPSKTPRPTPTAIAAIPTKASASPTPTPEMGKIVVRAQPWATVFVDGKEVGERQRVEAPVAAGTHTLRIANAGKNFSREIRIKVRPGQTCEFPVVNVADPKATLQPAPGCS